MRKTDTRKKLAQKAVPKPAPSPLWVPLELADKLEQISTDHSELLSTIKMIQAHTCAISLRLERIEAALAAREHVHRPFEPDIYPHPREKEDVRRRKESLRPRLPLRAFDTLEPRID